MNTERDRDVLRRPEVVSPCKVSWDRMRGDDRVRFCGQCRLRVYNLSGLSRRAAASLVASREGRLCVTFHRRPDGTVVTRDCGAAGRRIAHALFVGICAFISLVVAGTAAGIETWMTEVRWPGKGKDRGQASMGERSRAMGMISVARLPAVPGPVELGDVAPAPAPALEEEEEEEEEAEHGQVLGRLAPTATAKEPAPGGGRRLGTRR